MSGTLAQSEIQAVETALRAVLCSRAFKSSERMCRFLRLSVEHALHNGPDPLKEYEIAVAVFDRGKDFDPHQDPIVRVEARRLRKKLKEYYEGEGRDDAVVIDFPDRGYVPSFRLPWPERRGLRWPVKRRALVSGLALSVPAIIAAIVLWTQPFEKRPSIIVLPFLNLSSDPANEYIGDGFTEEITNVLAGMPDLRVVARTSAFHFKGRGDDVRAIGDRVSAQWVLEGSIRKEADRLRVTVQLVEADTGLHVWSHTYDTDVSGLLDVQERIANQVGRALNLVLSAHHPAPAQAIRPEAYEAYLKGRYFWYRLKPEAVRKSISYLNQAVELEPAYAAAYAALADSYSLLPQLELEPPAGHLERCKSAAERALALDRGSAEAHYALGVARAIADRDFAASEGAFLRALELKPNLTAARQAYAVMCLSPTRRHDRAIAEMRRVVRDDPVSPVARFALGLALAYAGRLDEAIQELRASLELDPDLVYASQGLAVAYLANSRYVDAQAELERTIGAAGTDPYHAGLLGYTYGRVGDTAGATRMLERLTSPSRLYVPPFEVAGIYNGLDQREECTRWLERAYQDRSPQLVWVAVDPRFASLRQDAKFVALLQRMGLASRH